MGYIYKLMSGCNVVYVGQASSMERMRKRICEHEISNKEFDNVIVKPYKL